LSVEILLKVVKFLTEESLSSIFCVICSSTVFESAHGKVVTIEKKGISISGDDSFGIVLKL